LAERFYFDLTDGVTTISDETGVMALDLSDALLQAKALMVEMDELEDHEVDAHKWMIVVRDSAGATITTIPLVPRDSAALKAS
jgi:microcompartment protein CcmK/EutM